MNYKPKSRNDKLVIGFKEVKVNHCPLIWLWEDTFFCFDREDLSEFKEEELKNLLGLLEGSILEVKDALEKSSK